MIPLVEQHFADERITQPLDLVEGLVRIGAGSATAIAIVAAGAGQQHKPEREAGQDHAAQGRQINGGVHESYPRSRVSHGVGGLQRLMVPQMLSLPGAPFSSIELGSSTTIESTLKPSM